MNADTAGQSVAAWQERGGLPTPDIESTSDGEVAAPNPICDAVLVFEVASRAPDLVDAVATRTKTIIEQISLLDEAALLYPSHLPGWNRLTIACHLRYGSQAFLRLTHGALARERVAYYPEGRELRRPATLVPEAWESPFDVIDTLAAQSETLHEAWAALDPDDWSLEVHEPEDQPDLGSLTLSWLPLLRLTEVEVHGSDLGLGLDDWSELFVTAALHQRLEWLNVRRPRPLDDELRGSWLLVATDGPAYLVSVAGDTVISHAVEPTTAARAVIEATSRDLLALLLGRPFQTSPRLSGDLEFAGAFSRALPGP